MKFRFRRLKESLELDSETALRLIDRDATPMFVDPDFVARTWRAMVRVTGRDEALEAIVLRHPGALVTQPQNVEAKINEIKTGAAVIGAFSDFGKSFGGLFAGGLVAGLVSRQAVGRRRGRGRRTAMRAVSPDAEDLDEAGLPGRHFDFDCFPLRNGAKIVDFGLGIVAFHQTALNLSSSDAAQPPLELRGFSLAQIFLVLGRASDVRRP